MISLTTKTGEYYKGINIQTNEMEFTASKEEAKKFQNRWFVNAHINFLKYHFPDKNEIISNLEMNYEL